MKSHTAIQKFPSLRSMYSVMYTLSKSGTVYNNSIEITLLYSQNHNLLQFSVTHTFYQTPLLAEENKVTSPRHLGIEPKKMWHAQKGFEVSSCISTIQENFFHICVHVYILLIQREIQLTFQKDGPSLSCSILYPQDTPSTFLHQARISRYLQLKMTIYVKRSSIQPCPMFPQG